MKDILVKTRFFSSVTYSSVIFYAISLIFLFSCSQKKAEHSPMVFTSVLPHKFIIEKIAGDNFSAQVLIGEGQTAHHFSPTPGQVARLSEAVLFFRTGVEFEEAIIPKIKKTVKGLSIIDLRKNISLLQHEEEEENEHDHGHAESEYDPHIWLSPVLMKQQARVITTALQKIDPDQHALYEKNLSSLQSELDSLHTMLTHVLGPFKGETFFVFHPAFGYFAREYTLVQKAVEAGGKEPSAKALTQLIEAVKKEQVKVIFVQPQYSRKSAEIIAQLTGCIVVPINPMPADYIQEMKQLGEIVRQSLSL
ncbi:MAG: zinc ABC transporter substrate-binding protein [Fibrobacteria bacterium]|nr:zinc ABC transporter substrate-binding protein [Fibrobacteria bacterium]